MGPSAASVLRSLMKMTTRVDGATVIMWVVQIKRQMKLLLVALALAVPLAEAADRCGGCKTLVDQFKSVRTRSTADSSRCQVHMHIDRSSPFSLSISFKIKINLERTCHPSPLL